MIFTVAIDGPAAAGKGTISRAVPAHFGFAHLDTGLLYRAVGMLALEAGGLDETRATNAAKGLSPEVRPDGVVIFRAGDGTMSVMPATEYDGDDDTIVSEIDPFA